jgi:hypothetical protein
MDKKFIINLQGKEFVLFAGLLAEFHATGGKSIETEETPTSTPDEPRFKAIVKGERGEFIGHGDANNANTGKMVSVHKYRMAETRAIARALRWYDNIGLCSLDELGGDDYKPKFTKISNAKNLLFVKIKQAAGTNTPTDDQILKAISDKSGIIIKDKSEITEEKAKAIIELWT